MTPTNEAFEALMPQPFDHLYEFASPFGGTTLRESASEYNGNRPKRSIALYTADQMRRMFDDTTERAAKLCESTYPELRDGELVQLPCFDSVLDCAAAIRGDGGAT